MQKPVLRIALAIALILFLTACAAPVTRQEHTGFISDYSNLEEADKQAFLFVSDKLVNYHTFIIDPVAILYVPDEENRIFTDEQLAELQEYYRDKLGKALTRDDEYAVVTEPGPGVARLRYAITHVDDTIGVLNLSIYTKITGAGLGGVAIEGELIDSLSGEQLAASVRWGSGNRILPFGTGYTKTGDAKILLNRWSKLLRKRLDKLHQGGQKKAKPADVL
jgi:hypothetical protein